MASLTTTINGKEVTVGDKIINFRGEVKTFQYERDTKIKVEEHPNEFFHRVFVDKAPTIKAKLAIDLKPGDKIVSDGTFPDSLYSGVVKSVTVVDAGVQVNLAEGGCYTRPENHPFTVESA